MNDQRVNSNYVIGVDVGTSGVRAVALDSGNVAIAVSRALYTDFDPQPQSTGSYRSPEVWWAAVRRSVRSVVEQLPDQKAVAISVDGTSGTVLPIDQHGEPVSQPMMYNDTVDDASILESIAAVMPHHSAAGGTTSGLAKVIKFASQQPAAVVHQADWIVGKLCDNFTHSDANNALKTGFDPVGMKWPEWINEVADVISLLPDVAIPGDVVDEVSESIANDLGMVTPVKLVAGTTDGCAAFLATGASEVGDAVTSLGSTLTLKLLCEKPVFAPEFGIYSHRIGHTWLAGGASNTGGSVLAHYFSNVEIRQLSQQIDTNKPTGLDYYPLVNPGERFPVNDPVLAPRVHPRPASDVEFLQGLLEGIATIEHTGYQKLVSAGAPTVKTIRSVGGGAANTAFTSIRQNKSGLLFKPTISEEAAFGVATLAKIAADQLALW